MKKILSGIIALSVIFCSLPSVFATTYSSRGRTTVESDINAEIDSKTASVNKQSKLDITTLFSWAAVDTMRPSEKKITITSNAGRVVEGTEHPYIPSQITLRIVNPNAAKKRTYVAGTEYSDTDDEKISVYEYFMLTVSDDSGVLYKAENIPSDTSEIEVPLKIFNYDFDNGTTFYSDEHRYRISLQKSKDYEISSVTDYTLPTRWKWYIDTKQQPDYIDGVPTPSPAPEATDEPEPTAAPADESGSDENNATLTPATSTPDSNTQETTANVRPTTTPRVRATASPRPTATPKTSAASTVKTTAAPKTSATAAPKTNPKTGDTAPLMSLSVAGMLSLMIIAIVQLKKNKN